MINKLKRHYTNDRFFSPTTSPIFHNMVTVVYGRPQLPIMTQKKMIKK